MEIKTIKYKDYKNLVPQAGKHILAQQSDDTILVYMAFNKQIADFAIRNQKLGGELFRFNRMSWIKTNFLWMMYRSGWASKVNQERILAIWITKSDFELILENSVHSSYQNDIYQVRENWERELTEKDVRLQWDPDHSPEGNKEERRAIQLGIKDKILRLFATKMIIQIDDITDFIHNQKELLKNKGISELTVPNEKIFIPNNDNLRAIVDYD